MTPFPGLFTGKRTRKPSAEAKHETMRTFPRKGTRERKANETDLCSYPGAEKAKN